MRDPKWRLLLCLPLLLAACGAAERRAGPARGDAGGPVDYDRARHQMVEQQIAARGIREPRVLAALGQVPRHEFVPEEARAHAYEDRPLPIGYDQTISQPYVVALMTELARLPPEARVLEIGTGSGYQAAVLAQIAAEVYSIEILEPLAAEATQRLARLAPGVRVRHGDGYRGWPEAAPFHAILVTAAAPRVPPALIEQLVLGGRLVIPVGEGTQELEVHERTVRGTKVERVTPVRFVPMKGEVRRRPG